MGIVFGGAPYGDTKRCTGWCVTHAKFATGAFGGAPHGPRNAAPGGGDACGRSQWGLWWSSLWATKRCA
eukprot:3169454-Pyramimonas_sp.AAC.1